MTEISGATTGNVPTKEPAKRPTKVLGALGIAIYGGYVLEREQSYELASHEHRYKTFEDILLNTSIAAAAVRYFLRLVSGATWSFVPAEADHSEEYVALTEAMLMEDPATRWTRIIRRAGTYPFYGFSIHEWIAKRRMDGVITFSDIQPRAQHTIERWARDPTTRLLIAAIQRDPQNSAYLPLPRSKLLYLVDDALSDSPAGLGLFRQLVEPARRLRRYEQLEGWGFELDLRGIPIVRAPIAELDKAVEDETMTPQERKQIEEEAKKFLENHLRTPDIAAFLDSMTYETTDDASRPSNIRKWDIELLKGAPTGQAENASAIERVNREIARILGVEQLLLGSGSAGSFALSRDKTNSFFLLVDSALKEIREAVEDDLIKTLWLLNGWPPEMMPTLSVEAVRHTDVIGVTTALRNMATAGVMLDPNDPVVGEIFALMGLSQPQKLLGLPATAPDMDDEDDLGDEDMDDE